MATEPTGLRLMGKHWACQWRDDNGQRRTKRFGSSGKVLKRDATRAYNNWLVQFHNDPTIRNPSDEGELTVSRLKAAYDDYAKEYYRKPDGRPTGEARGVAESMAVAVELFADLPVREFKPSCLRAVQELMIDRKHARNTINGRINRIRRVFKWAVSNEMIPAHVLTGLQTVAPLKRGRSGARETEAVTPVHRSHVEAVFDELPQVLIDMIELQWLTGMRSGELVSMSGRDIEMKGKVWTYRPTSHKTEHHGHDRVIPLGPQAQAIVKEYLRPDLQACLFDPHEAEKQRKAKCKTHRRRKNEEPRTTPRQVGDWYTSASYRRAITRAIDATNAKREAENRKDLVPQWTPHQIRHSVATRVRKDYGLEAARVLLGHSKTDATELYAEMDQAKATQIAAAIG